MQKKVEEKKRKKKIEEKTKQKIVERKKAESSKMARKRKVVESSL